MNFDKRNEAEKKIAEVFAPLVKGMAMFPDDVELIVLRKNIGAIPGVLVEIKCAKVDARRIYGKSGQNYNSLGVIAEGIGYACGVPVALGYLHEPTKFPEEVNSRKDRAGAMSLIKQLVERVAEMMFPGAKPVVEIGTRDAGVMDIRIQVSPSSTSIMQRRWVAMTTIFRGICAPYSWLPNIELIQDLPDMRTERVS